MGINSTEVAYNFGQLGSAVVNETGAFTPPTGMVVIAMTFLGDISFSALVADVSGHDATPVAGNVGYFSHTAAVPAVHGAGANETASDTLFPTGLTVYGRWTGFTLGTADSDGGVICYFGK